MRCLIVADDRSEAGLGHVTRMGALRDELGLRGWECETFSVSPSFPVDTIVGLPSADVLIVDRPAGAPACGLASRGARSVAIVDVDGVYGGVDLLVCGSAGAHHSLFAGSLANRTLSGPQFSLLRPEFRGENESGRLTRQLLNDRGACDLRKIQNVSAADLAYLLHAVPVVITYGGMRAMEAACCGVPMVVIPRNDGEWLNAQGLADAGAAVICHREQDVIAAAQDLLDRPDDWPAMSAAGRALVDGLGCKRVADEIEALVQEA